MIRATGAYFVRRGSGNPLYRRVLERYIHMATAAGVTQAVYPEGGLSRDGHLRPPKLGILDYMLRGFDPRGERDLVFIPVGINYDRVLEDRTLLLDLPHPGQPAPEARKGPLAAAATALGFALRHQPRTVADEACNFVFGASQSDRLHRPAGLATQRGQRLKRRLG